MSSRSSTASNIFWYDSVIIDILLFIPLGLLVHHTHRAPLTCGRSFEKKKHSSTPYLAYARSVFLKMSQTSSTPGRLQSNDSRQRQSLLEEIQRLKKAHADASHLSTWALEEWDKDRKENTRIRLDMESLRISAEEAEGRAEEAEHRAEEAERRAEKAERNLSRIQGRVPEIINAWRAMGQAFRNVTGQTLDDSNDAKFVPEDEGKVDYQGQSIAQASEGEEIDDQGQQSDQASQHEETDYQAQQGDQASQGEQSYYMGQRSDQASEGENELHSFEPETISNLEDDSQSGSS